MSRVEIIGGDEMKRKRKKRNNFSSPLSRVKGSRAKLFLSRLCVSLRIDESKAGSMF